MRINDGLCAEDGSGGSSSQPTMSAAMAGAATDQACSRFASGRQPLRGHDNVSVNVNKRTSPYVTN